MKVVFSTPLWRITTVMNPSIQSKIPGKVIWAAYLVIALAFVQVARLHLHVYDHAPVTADDRHHEQVHPDIGVDKQHPDEIAPIDLSHQGVLKKLSFGSPVVALLAAAIVLLISRLCARVAWRRETGAPLNSWYGYRFPPLRGPPAVA